MLLKQTAAPKYIRRAKEQTKLLGPPGRYCGEAREQKSLHTQGFFRKDGVTY